MESKLIERIVLVALIVFMISWSWAMFSPGLVWNNQLKQITQAFQAYAQDNAKKMGGLEARLGVLEKANAPAPAPAK